jgi:LPXTG-site transpeptidase (sortase) family protein
MDTRTWPSKAKPSKPARPSLQASGARRHISGAQRSHVGRRISGILLAVGAVFLAAALLYGLYSLLNMWIMGQDRYLRADSVAALSVPAMTWTPSPAPTSTALPTFTPAPTAIPANTSIPAPTLIPAPASPPAPVQIRIPALGVKRSIVPLARVRDSRTGALTWNTKSLFRSGRSDLVGHWDGSAYPGQVGNMVLVGHNYGYGYNGVFVRVGSLNQGDEISVVNAVGETFTYRVSSVSRVKWRKQSFAELTQHLNFLAPGGSERVTLVSCGGAEVEPFPERVYVVAERVR